MVGALRFLVLDAREAGVGAGGAAIGVGGLFVAACLAEARVVLGGMSE